MGSVGTRATALRQRLLQDIAELQEKPYPRIRLHVDDDDLTTACLILTPENWKGLHLTVQFGDTYPLKPPRITIQSQVNHPNVFNTYICASILNTEEGYTPAYTLKGIAIQLLSFFSSDKLEQTTGGSRSLGRYKERDRKGVSPKHRCEKCGFGCGSSKHKAPALAVSDSSTTDRGVDGGAVPSVSATGANHLAAPHIDKLPDEILLLILEELEFEDLTLLARAWPRIERMMTGYDLIRTRELQCYVLKKGYRQVDLGVGVNVVLTGRQGTIQSEFDLISRQAVHGLAVRKSIHGIPFWVWLPIPISHAHWRRVECRVPASLSTIADAAKLTDPGLVLYAFMNDIVVRLNQDIETRVEAQHSSKSTLRHASEKAIEAYFHLFHLLLCLGTSPAGRGMVPAANRMIESFLAGRTTKAHVPNLGYLLIALLISDVEVTERLVKAIITETITRNVVWLLDRKGAGMADLAYLEADEICEYRLKKTFEGSRTSYRLLMFSELFRRTARPSVPEFAVPHVAIPTPPAEQPATVDPVPQSYSSAAAAPRAVVAPPQPHSEDKTSLLHLRDELFARHGGPPPGAAARLASEVRRLQKIDDFPSFLREMGIEAVPSRSVFTALLRSTVVASHERGYSKPALSQPAALALRLGTDGVGGGSLDMSLVQGQLDGWAAAGRSGLPDPDRTWWNLEARRITFFPGGGTGGRGGRGHR
jgi:ubiquitin-protein ligase